MRPWSPAGRAPIVAALLLLAACGRPPATDAASLAEPTSAPSPAPAPLAPAEYLKLHNLAASPRDPGWEASVRELAVAGDGYTLVRLQALDRAALTDAQAASVDATIAALSAGPAGVGGPPSADEIRTRLERAAWADMHCDPCELTLVPWATKSLADVAADAGVRATLEALRDGYEPAADLAPSSQWGSFSERVRGYAAKILQGGGGQAAKQSP